MAKVISNKSRKRKCSWCGKKPPKLYQATFGSKRILCRGCFRSYHGYPAVRRK